LSGRGLCDELITRPEESYRLCCVVVCDLETSRIGAPYIYDISNLRVKKKRFLSHFKILAQLQKYFFWSETDQSSKKYITGIIFLWRFDPIIRYGLPLRWFVNTLFGNTTLSRTSLDELSSQRKVLYKTTHNNHKRQTSVSRRDSNPQS